MKFFFKKKTKEKEMKQEQTNVINIDSLRPNKNKETNGFGIGSFVAVFRDVTIAKLEDGTFLYITIDLEDLNKYMGKYVSILKRTTQIDKIIQKTTWEHTIQIDKMIQKNKLKKEHVQPISKEEVFSLSQNYNKKFYQKFQDGTHILFTSGHCYVVRKLDDVRYMLVNASTCTITKPVLLHQLVDEISTPSNPMFIDKVSHTKNE